VKELLSDEFAVKLKQLAAEKAEQYQTAKPFPHIYFDNFLPIEAAEAALRDFPEPKQLSWNQFDNPNEKKLAFDAVEKLPPGDRDALFFLNSRPMVEFLEVLTGIKGVIPDPYYVGGGLHQIKPGGMLAIHADFNHHDKLNLDRRINVLIYLNKDWKEEYGGQFELWNKEMTHADVKILPLFNRCAIFSTTSTSWHGNPEVVKCPAPNTRKSLATYYYTNGRPDEEVTDGHSTLFKSRPGDAPQAANASFSFKSIVRAVTPPIITDAVKSIAGKK
jgi:Rps23 Pro-64 3,4-dihydroxylase Tpa1-like proline 4-hydroxylase